MKIVRATEVPHVKKPEGTTVRYYMFRDYEVHYNDQAPHTTQAWHHHDRIWETLYVIEGELTAFWREGGEEKTQKVVAGDLIETERSPHTFSNDSDEIVRFLVMKRIPSPDDHRDTFKNDKILD